ncbi:hypothetical protein [Actinacidiphila rubida]|uniref:hypothetical protein n=1 Tax=Actinacidiphila rubida TaxID=310780 RepID=UPI000849A0F1|nr:hypothetical protein [Actinacidiphila rubida]
MLVWWFGGNHSSTVSYVAGAVAFVLTVLAVASSWWMDRHPDTEQRVLDKQARAFERRARQAEAAEASRRATGRH